MKIKTTIRYYLTCHLGWLVSHTHINSKCFENVKEMEHLYNSQDYKLWQSPSMSDWKPFPQMTGLISDRDSDCLGWSIIRKERSKISFFQHQEHLNLATRHYSVKLNETESINCLLLPIHRHPHCTCLVSRAA